VAPFRGTFQAYDANLAVSTLFSLRPSIFSSATPLQERRCKLIVGVPNQEGRGGAPAVSSRLDALDRGHRVKRIDYLTNPVDRCQPLVRR
jgi:hypothetical protein